MNLRIFNKLTQDQKTDIVSLHGTVIDERQDDNHHIFLYQIDAFYVELYFSNNTNELDYLESFSTTNKLKPYLERINLELLLQDI